MDDLTVPCFQDVTNKKGNIKEYKNQQRIASNGFMLLPGGSKKGLFHRFGFKFSSVL